MPQHPSATPKYFWHGQFVHAIGLAVLLGLVWLSADRDHAQDRTFAGITTQGWFLISLLIPILHQVFVWLTWRSELCFGGLSRALGTHVFEVYRVVFFVLFVARPITQIMLAIADHDSLEISIPVRIIACTVVGLPALYAGYSVARYFGVSRASGADHFDTSYRDLPLVTEGIFKYSSNSMYVFAFLALWAIGIAAASWLAIVSAAFSHAYIWVHYFCTEKPDMGLIYGNPTD
jgi:hypothetical protein